LKQQSIGERIVIAREHQNWSAADLRRELGNLGIKISRSRLWNYENRPETLPKPEILIAIAEITGFNIAWLFAGQEPMLLQQKSNSKHQSEDQLLFEQLSQHWSEMTTKQRTILIQICNLVLAD